MKAIRKVLLCSLLTACAIGVMSAMAAPASDDDQWPKVVNGQSEIFKVYQPQIDSWDGFTLQAHSAVGVQKNAKDNNMSYGVATFTVKTIVDKDSRIVKFEGLKINEVSFPSDPSQEKAYLSELRTAAPLQMQSIALDRLEANLAILEEQKKGEAHQLNNDPPKIIFSDKLAVLALIDGEPVFAPVKGTKLSRVLNTNVLLLKDASGKFYLHVFGGYMDADDINGTWVLAKKAPAGADIAEKTEGVDLMNAQSDSQDSKSTLTLAKGNVPVVYVSNTPAELIVTEGEPNFVPLNGTKLLYVSNTSANVLEDMGGTQLYVLISGRWFRSASKAGPWEYVPADKLPADFAGISDSGAKENVKASVAGTVQAREALIANNIPTTSKIERSTAKLNVKIDGDPVIKPIEGTALSYVFNCSVPLIRVDEESWYAVSDGVWYTSKSIEGPFAAADSVPAVIYSIPTNSPLHYVTYVRVYDSNAEYVYEGHTPGYYGTVVSPDGTVVYGTGYSYPSYIGDDYWYPPMYTYGYGSGLCWTPWYGWSFGFGFGWGFGALWYNPPFPYWGHNRFGHGSFGHRGYSNPGHFGRAYNSRTGQMISGRSGAVTNVFGAGRSPGFAAGRTHVYGSRSGHVYSYTPQGKTGAWSHLGRQSGAPPQGREASSFSRQAGARDLGEARYRSFRNNGGSSNISSPTNSHSSSSRSSGGRSFGGSGSGSRGGGSGFGGGGGMGGWGGKR